MIMKLKLLLLLLVCSVMSTNFKLRNREYTCATTHFARTLGKGVAPCLNENLLLPSFEKMKNYGDELILIHTNAPAYLRFTSEILKETFKDYAQQKEQELHHNEKIPETIEDPKDAFKTEVASDDQYLSQKVYDFPLVNSLFDNFSYKSLDISLKNKILDDLKEHLVQEITAYFKEIETEELLNNLEESMEELRAELNNQLESYFKEKNLQKFTTFKSLKKLLKNEELFHIYKVNGRKEEIIGVRLYSLYKILKLDDLNYKMNVTNQKGKNVLKSRFKTPDYEHGVFIYFTHDGSKDGKEINSLAFSIISLKLTLANYIKGYNLMLNELPLKNVSIYSEQVSKLVENFPKERDFFLINGNDITQIAKTIEVISLLNDYLQEQIKIDKGVFEIHDVKTYIVEERERERERNKR
jgi:hypothetical protein